MKDQPNACSVPYLTGIIISDAGATAEKHAGFLSLHQKKDSNENV